MGEEEGATCQPLALCFRIVAAADRVNAEYHKLKYCVATLIGLGK